MILEAGRYDDIRYALDPTIDGEEMLPDVLIASPAYLGEAERWAISLDPLYASRIGAEKDALERAIIYKTAALLSAVVPQARQVNMAGHSATVVFAESPQERTARLHANASLAIEEYITIPVVPDDEILVFVTTASGQRG